MRFNSLLLLGLWSLAVQPGLAAEDILKPEQAFRYEVSATADEITVRWDIEPEHYMYKERMGYRSLTDGLSLGDAILPNGKPYEDEFFGPMEIYRGQAVVRIPVVERAAGMQTAELEIRSQGCADIGLCYPPQKWTSAVAFTGGGGGTLNRLLGTTGSGPGVADEPLPADEAFQASITVLDPFRIAIDWQIENGYYLYRDSLSVAALGNIAQPGQPVIPMGTPKWDENFGDTEVFYDEVRIEVPLTRPNPAGGLLELDVGWQGCKEDSICYPPGVMTLGVDLPTATVGDLPDAPAPISEQDKLSQLIVQGNLFLVIATFTGLGLLLAFTPCVLPMVPILSGVIAGQGKDVTTGRAFALSLTYVLGMAFTYTIAGAAFAAAGGQIQAALQKPWIIISVAGLFIALAMSMFGMYELQMPSAIQSRLTNAGSKQKTGTFVGTAVLGALSALVVTTCVAPPLVASLTVIAQAGDITRGAASLFAMSIGMGIPLLVIGTSAGRLLPKAGEWMNKVKGAFGFMMLGLAVWMLERILPGPVTLALWGVLIFVAGVFLGAFTTLMPDARASLKLGKGFGLLAAFYGVALLLGALSGGSDPLRPLAFTGGAVGGAAHEELEFRPVKTVADLEREVAAAQMSGQPVMLDFYADWCVSCKEMERYTFTDDQVHAALNGVVLLQADVTANDAADQELLAHFGIFGPPTIVFFDGSGAERDQYRVVGFMSADKFASHVTQALRGS
ncbi:MAG: protein-disulfide reductase DsbD [Gammaproteobacteria bacterium]|nr:protein-disulfide reductase DsbD [Gammaproteobacteria bacterium]